MSTTGRIRFADFNDDDLLDFVLYDPQSFDAPCGHNEYFAVSDVMPRRSVGSKIGVTNCQRIKPLRLCDEVRREQHDHEVGQQDYKRPA